jgi:hypothetical protein
LDSINAGRIEGDVGGAAMTDTLRASSIGQLAEQRAAAEGGTSGANSVPKSPWFTGESRGIAVRLQQLENLLFPATLRTESGQ